MQIVERHQKWASRLHDFALQPKHGLSRGDGEMRSAGSDCRGGKLVEAVERAAFDRAERGLREAMQQAVAGLRQLARQTDRKEYHRLAIGLRGCDGCSDRCRSVSSVP